jgi:hypothetical protein
MEVQIKDGILKKLQHQKLLHLLNQFHPKDPHLKLKEKFLLQLQLKFTKFKPLFQNFVLMLKITLRELEPI